MMKQVITVGTTIFLTIYGYSNLIEKRSFSSFCIERLLKINFFLDNKSSAEDKIHKLLDKSIEISEKPLEKPQKYISTEVSDFYIDNMQVFYWNDKQDKNQKIIFYIHGGGYVSAPIGLHYKMLDKIAKQTNAKIVFPIYDRLPTATYKDVYPKMLNLYKRILDEVNSSEQITLMGDSAGGGLSLGIALNLKKHKMNQPKDIILLSPWLDISNNNPNIKEMQKYDPILEKSQLNILGEMWSDGDLENELVSPKNGSPENLGKISLFTGVHEIFYPDIMDYHRNLKRLNIPHNLIVESRMNHVYPIFPIPEAKVAQKKIIEIVNS